MWLLLCVWKQPKVGRRAAVLQQFCILLTPLPPIDNHLFSPCSNVAIMVDYPCMRIRVQRLTQSLFPLLFSAPGNAASLA